MQTPEIKSDCEQNVKSLGLTSISTYCIGHFGDNLPKDDIQNTKPSQPISSISGSIISFLDPSTVLSK